MKIYLIRLSQRLSSQAMGTQPTELVLQVQQTHTLEVLGVTDSRGWSKGPLASAPHVLFKALAHVGIDVPKSFARITVAKVVCPASEVSIELLDKLWQRHKAPLRTHHLTQLLPLSHQSLLRYGHVEISVTASSPIAIVAKRVPQKVELLSRLRSEEHT